MAATRVVVLGGGCGGLELASALAGRREMEVTLVDRVGSHLWKPRLHEFAAGTVNSTLTEISFYMLGRMRGFRFEQGEVEALDRRNRKVRLAAMPGPDGRPVAAPRHIAYDVCVIALGGVTPDFGTDGVAEYALRLDEKADADDFRELFVCLMLHARESGKPAQVVIVGSGATGTELAAHLRLAERAFFERGAAERGASILDITILEAAPELMPGASEELRQGVTQRLDALDIAHRTGALVTEVKADAVRTSDGESWGKDVAVWAAGLVGHPVLADLADFELDDNGRIVVDQRLRSSVDPAIYVLGDAASLTPEGAEQPLPPTAQCASQQASYLTAALPEAVAGREPPEFDYNDKARLLSLGQAGSVGRMAFRSRDDFYIKGQFATAAYKALQRKHQWAVLGPVRGSVAILADLMTPTKGPALKLHG